jgi:hypothetical protein
MPELSTTEKILMGGIMDAAQRERDKYEVQMFQINLWRAIREFTNNENMQF